jgi:hypothetical protein
MEFLILLAVCVLIVGVVAWFGRRRSPNHRSVRYADMSSAMRQQRLAALENGAKGLPAGDDHGSGTF